MNAFRKLKTYYSLLLNTPLKSVKMTSSRRIAAELNYLITPLNFKQNRSLRGTQKITENNKNFENRNPKKLKGNT